VDLISASPYGNPFPLRVMQLAEVTAEKIRALCMREATRDVYDLWMIATRRLVDTRQVAKLAPRKMETVHLALSLDTVMGHLAAIERVWVSELRLLIADVPDFAQVASDLRPWLTAILAGAAANAQWNHSRLDPMIRVPLRGVCPQCDERKIGRFQILDLATTSAQFLESPKECPNDIIYLQHSGGVMIATTPTQFIDLPALVQRLREQLLQILDARPVQLAYLYGSAAADSTTPLSDIDIALVAGQPLTVAEQLDLELEVQVELAHRTGIRNADVRLLDRAPLLLRGQVLSHGVLLYARDEDFRVDFESRTRDKYFDFKPLADAERNSFFAYLRTRQQHG
jgi:uncharacterized protein